MALPTRCAATYCPAAGQAVNPQPTSSPKCFILYDRHIEKNGGSTVRTLFKRLEEHGECSYWGYDISRGGWRSAIQELRNISQGAGGAPFPRLCIEAHCGHATESFRHLQQLGELQRSLASSCVVRRVTRIRNPISHYASFFSWARAIRGNGLATASAQNLTFAEWAAQTPNLQSSILLNSDAATTAKQEPRARSAVAQARLIARVRERDVARWRGVLDGATRLYDLLVPLERFDEALLLLADELGLRHVQHHRVSPGSAGSCAPTYPERIDLDDPQSCAQLERELQCCPSVSAMHAGRARRRAEARRRAADVRRVASEWVNLLRRVAPLDFALYELAATRFNASLEAHGQAARRRLRAQHRHFLAASRGVWLGGPPARAPCKFVRTAYSDRPDFEHHPCTPGPQALLEAVWRDTGYLGRANLVPNDARCLGQPHASGCARFRG